MWLRKPGLTNSALAPGLGVHADDRVLDRVQPVNLLAVPELPLPLAALGEVVAELAVAVVHRGELLGQPLHRRGQRLVRELASAQFVSPPYGGRATARRIEPSGGRRHERDVGVPDVGTRTPLSALSRA